MNATPTLSAQIGALTLERANVAAQLPKCKTIDEYDDCITRIAEIETELETLIAKREIARWAQSAEEKNK